MDTAKIAMLAASTETQAAMRSYCLGAGFDLTHTFGGREITDDMFDFHVTLMATKEPVFIPVTDHVIQAIEVTPTGFEVLGKDEDTPVISLDAAGALQLARDFFLDVYGAEPTFEDFKPHVSLSYNWSGSPALDEIELPSFPLLFDRLIVTEFKPEQKSLLLLWHRKRLPGAHAVYR